MRQTHSSAHLANNPLSQHTHWRNIAHVNYNLLCHSLHLFQNRTIHIAIQLQDKQLMCRLLLDETRDLTTQIPDNSQPTLSTPVWDTCRAYGARQSKSANHLDMAKAMTSLIPWRKCNVYSKYIRKVLCASPVHISCLVLRQNDFCKRLLGAVQSP